MSNISFAIGTGRCGTLFLSEVIKREKEFSSVHERDPLNDTFHRYCKWNKISVDHEGFLFQKDEAIKDDFKKKKFSFEASAFLSLSVAELYKRFNCKFVFLVRSPEKVINSLVQKGWYKYKTVYENPDLPLTFQANEKFHHFLGRIIPGGKELVKWNNLSRISKLCWYWVALNEQVLKQLAKIPKENYITRRIEDIDYETYRDLISFLGANSTVSKKIFLSIAEAKPNSLKIKPAIEKWSEEDKEYVKETASPLAEFFKYDLNEILKSQDKNEQVEIKSVFKEKSWLQLLKSVYK